MTIFVKGKKWSNLVKVKKGELYERTLFSEAVFSVTTIKQVRHYILAKID